jgi:hypothetical protein
VVLLNTANSSINDQKRTLPASNSANCTIKYPHTGKYIYFAKDFAYLCIATYPPPLVIDKDPNHKLPSDSNIDDNKYCLQSKLLSLHMNKNSGILKSGDGAEPMGNTDYNKIMQQWWHQGSAPFAANL